MSWLEGGKKLFYIWTEIWENLTKTSIFNIIFQMHERPLPICEMQGVKFQIALVLHLKQNNMNSEVRMYYFSFRPTWNYSWLIPVTQTCWEIAHLCFCDSNYNSRDMSLKHYFPSQNWNVQILPNFGRFLAFAPNFLPHYLWKTADDRDDERLINNKDFVHFFGGRRKGAVGQKI